MLFHFNIVHLEILQDYWSHQRLLHSCRILVVFPMRQTMASTIVNKCYFHSMIGTIKARRAINGRNIFQENFYTSPNTRRVRAESQGNTSSTLSIPTSNNRSKANDNSMSPLCKKRKLT